MLTVVEGAMDDPRAFRKSSNPAPLNRDVEVWVTDGVQEYRLRVPCRRTEDGWIDARLKIPLSHRLKVLAWRQWK
jgi:hypothetical protein